MLQSTQKAFIIMLDILGCIVLFSGKNDRLCYVRPHTHAAREYGMELFGKYYFCRGSEELQELRRDPKKYLSGKKMLPEKLPSILSTAPILEMKIVSIWN